VAIERIFLDKIPSKNFYNISNYFLRKISKKSLIVISAGIGTDASFEATMIKKFNIKKLIAIDPTPIGKKTIKKIKSKKIYFENKALYIHNEKIEAFVPFERDNTNLNLSIDNL
jgi:FkbM family methyltransferase